QLGKLFTDNPMPDLCMHAVIPAAGQSTRMGRPKLALPLGGRSVLERVIDALRDAGLDVLVVLGPHVADLAAAAQTAGASVLALRETTPHMRATVEAGLDHLHTRFYPPPVEPWLLSPADHPALDADLMRRLMN